MISRKCSATGRRGLASLELVLVFPMLMAPVAGIFLAARAAQHKTSAAVEARHRAWQRRAVAPPGRPLLLAGDPLDSAVGHTARRSVPGRPLFRRAFTAGSRAEVVAGTWDHRALPTPGGQGPLVPHEVLFTALADNLRGGVGFAVLKGNAQVLMLFASPALRSAGEALNVTVRAAGWFLKYLVTPVIVPIKRALEVAKKALDLAGRFSKSARRAAEQLGRFIDVLASALNAFDNLYEAAHGRPGGWAPGTERALQPFSR